MEPGAAVTGSDVSADGLIAELLDMGFDFDDITAAVGSVGPRRAEVLEVLLGGTGAGAGQARRGGGAPGRPASSSAQPRPSGKETKLSNPRGRFRQSSITDHIASAAGSRDESGREASTSFPCSQAPVDPRVLVGGDVCSKLGSELQSLVENSRSDCGHKDKISAVLQKYFGFSCLKSFQKEVLDTWLAHKDCLVLAATGSGVVFVSHSSVVWVSISVIMHIAIWTLFACMNDVTMILLAGKSLCFQIPALLTTKIVVVISPLISLMHDQCLKLAKHGISACFLGSGQPDSRVEGKAMAGMYKIVYVCPETVLRLMEPLKKLAEKPGIALFAIDEVHCVSKWGHDFRPDYRKLSVLRENFNSSKLKFLKHDIPLMALTATATIPVREDILKSLKMSEDTKIVLTSFFRPNLQFSVKHSKTSVSSYGKDFQELIGTYNTSRKFKGKEQQIIHEIDPDSESSSYDSLNDSASDDEDSNIDSASRGDKNVGKIKSGMTLVKENTENELDLYPGVDDFDVSCGEFLEGSAPESSAFPAQSSETSLPECLDQGPTIVYVPTRKETVELANFLCKSGLRAAAYNAKVVVATIAFGMGIDKSNVRRIIHYGFPQGDETEDMICSSVPHYRSGRRRFGEVPNFRMVVSHIREKLPRFATTDKIWWQGLARILEGMRYIQEAVETPRVSIQHPELTEDGLKFLSSRSEGPLYAHPDAAMLLAMDDPRPFSDSSEWGRGWADPEIRRQRLAGRKTGRRKRSRRSRQQPAGFTTARERLAAILSKKRRR
ncbi:ATP-dependent DNA helicase Q-like SIM [Dichanthelium oligosanthes]|uniref:ATP-dependent DNA helicase Q-like SIM n=1 Tax=Dichanthelium oligosanthes TaxID=888268 RepID=A0A1E5UMP4_9POAL|nr:ATP-dependent DNA helicase Q-like SIM [Dichanthelium oligosanthes]